MKRFRSALAFLLALALLFSLTGCAGGETQTTTEATQPSTQATSEATEAATENQTITLTDQAGRQVTLDGPAQTLVSCYYITTYGTLALGLGDRVAPDPVEKLRRRREHLSAGRADGLRSG